MACDPTKTMTTDLSLDSDHLTSGSTESKKEYSQHVEGDFVGLKPKRPIPLRLSIPPLIYADVEADSESITTLSFFQPDIAKARSMPTRTA
jgi:hypothetical protein